MMQTEEILKAIIANGGTLFIRYNTEINEWYIGYDTECPYIPMYEAYGDRGGTLGESIARIIRMRIKP